MSHCPEMPKTTAFKAPHLTDYFYLKNRGERIRTTIDPVIQERAAEIINSHQKDLSGNFIFNSAALIVKVATGEVLAYIGNSTNPDVKDHGGDVDIIRSPRSTGSILKPFPLRRDAAGWRIAYPTLLLLIFRPVSRDLHLRTLTEVSAGLSLQLQHFHSH